MFARKSSLISRLCDLAGEPDAMKRRNNFKRTSNYDDLNSNKFIKKFLQLFACGCNSDNISVANFGSIIKRLLQQLSYDQLDSLHLSVGSAGNTSESCIQLDLQKFQRKFCGRTSVSAESLAEWTLRSPHLILGIAYRWHTEIGSNFTTFQQLADCLMPLQCCNVKSDSCSVCLNPYHWTLVDQFQGMFSRTLPLNIL